LTRASRIGYTLSVAILHVTCFFSFTMSAIPNLPSDTPGIHTNSTAKGADIKLSFKLNNAPVENLRPMKVVVIGAGYSGIYCGIRIPERLRNVELVIYEKNAGVGGTWYENR
jgi:hypothetical protein